MIRFILGLLGVVFIFTGSPSDTRAATPLVDAAWVKANAGKPGIVFLDTRSRSSFMAGHIAGSVSTDYSRDGWRIEVKGVPGMLPDPARLARLIGSLGIGNDSHVVILPGGYSAGEMGVATRIYWTFKVAGHDAVSILDGGMATYLSDRKAPLVKGLTRPEVRSFAINMRPELLATADDVSRMIAAGSAGTLIDSRPNDQFLGVNKSSKVKRPGTLPGAVNLPGQWTTVDDGGAFRSRDALNTLYAAAGAATKGDTITFCNTGHWASLGWFVNSELLGNKKTKLYDGSLADWSRRPAAPIEAKIKLP